MICKLYIIIKFCQINPLHVIFLVEYLFYQRILVTVAATVPATPLLESVPRQDFVFYKGDMQYPKQAMDFNWQLIILKERGLILEYHQLCCLAYLERSIAENGNFSNRLLALMDNNNGISSRSMGFPQEWKTEPLWSM